MQSFSKKQPKLKVETIPGSNLQRYSPKVSIFNYSSEEIEDELQQDLANLRSLIK